MQNFSFLKELENQNFDFTIEQPLIFGVLFKDMNKANSFKNSILDYVYDKVLSIDFSEEEHNNMTDELYQQVYVQKSFKLSPAWLDIETLKINHIANEYEGEFQGVGLGELEENDLDGY